MSEQNRESEAIKHLQLLRNIGPVTAQRLHSIGIKTPEQLKRFDPEEIYQELKKKEGGKLDKCVLYQLKGSVLDVPWWECKNSTKNVPN